MNRIFIITAALAAFAGAANAEDAESVTVKVAGKTPEAVQHDIRMAARKVCDDELTGVFDNYFLKDSCVTDAVNKAQAQLTAAASAPAHAQDVASASR
jgi:hypothetical protein